MAICEYCHRQMLTADGCSVKKLKVLGKTVNRIKVGEPGDMFEDVTDPNFRCGDCGAKLGHYHHVGCDCELLPETEDQALMGLLDGEVTLPDGSYYSE